MKNQMKLTLIAALFFLLNFSSANAQNWSKEQQEVWKNVEAYNELLAANKVDESLAYFDDSYHGWYNKSQVPSDKGNLTKMLRYGATSSWKSVVHAETPLQIWVNGNFAYVDYYIYSVEKNDKGETRNRTETWTDILMKKGDKWVLVGDHGGPLPEKKSDND